MSKTSMRILATILLIVGFIFGNISPSKAYYEPLPKTGTDINVTIGKDGLIQLGEDGESKSREAWRELISEYKEFITGFSVIAAVTMILLFIFSFMKLGASAGNPKARSEAITGLLVTGIATALLGAVSLITYISYTGLK